MVKEQIIDANDGCNFGLIIHVVKLLSKDLGNILQTHFINGKTDM